MIEAQHRKLKPAMTVALVMACSVGGTLGLMGVISQLFGMDVPFIWWIFATLCPAVGAGIVATIFVRQIEQVRRLSLELARTQIELTELADRDHLTGLLNRRCFDRLASRLPVGWLILIDIDHFKHINDSFGHSIGDAALRKVAETIREAVREDNLVGRLGGDEFAVFGHGGPSSTVTTVAERIRAAICAAKVTSQDGRAVTLSASIGFARSQGDFDQAMLEADRAMYAAKQSGRNTIREAAMIAAPAPLC